MKPQAEQRGTAGYLPGSGAYEESLQHLELIYSKAARLRTRALEFEAQVVHRLATDFRAGITSAQEIYAAYARIKAAGGPGYSLRWNEHFPPELHHTRIRYTALHHAPDADGNWRGVHPFAEGSRTPPNGRSVVYVLFDAENEPCYVGSTEGFRLRLNAHSRDKAFTTWLAHPCADRESAYQLEERLLRQHKPYLNQKASR